MRHALQWIAASGAHSLSMSTKQVLSRFYGTRCLVYCRASGRHGADLRRHADQDGRGGLSRGRARLDGGRSRNARQPGAARARSRPRHAPDEARASREPFHPGFRRRAPARLQAENRGTDSGPEAENGDPAILGRPPPRPLHHGANRLRSVLSRGPEEPAPRGHAVAAAKNYLRLALRSLVAPHLRGGYHRRARQEAEGDPLLRLAVFTASGYRQSVSRARGLERTCGRPRAAFRADDRRPVWRALCDARSCFGRGHRRFAGAVRVKKGDNLRLSKILTCAVAAAGLAASGAWAFQSKPIPRNQWQLKMDAAEQAVKAGDLAAAEKNLLDALSAAEMFGPNDQHLLVTLDELGSLYERLGHYDQAERAYRRALDIWRRALGPDSPMVAKSLERLAAVYQAEGKQADALAGYQRAVTLLQKAGKGGDPLVATGLEAMGEIDRARGNYADAAGHYSQALKIWDKNFGPDHPLIAHAMN